MQIEHILKRDGRVVGFDAGKIAQAIAAAGRSTGELEPHAARALAATVAEALTRDGNVCPGVETIQNHVEEALVRAGHWRTARAYIVHREQHARLRSLRHAGGGRGKRDGGIPGAARLARQRQRQPGLQPGRPDPERGRQGHGQLLAVHVFARGGPGPPRRRHPHPRPGHAQRLLRRLVAAPAADRGLQRHHRQGRGHAAAPHVGRHRPDRQLPRHAAERMGRRAGLQLLRHLHGALHPPRRDDLRRRQAGDAGADLQPERAQPLGHADALHQLDLRLGLPGRPARADPLHRRRGNALRLRRPAGRDGYDQPRLHRGDDGRRRQGTRLHLSHPDLQHHARFRLGPSQHHAPVRDDGALRPALFPELPELGPGAAHGALHAAACSWTCASCSSAATVCSARPNRPARSAW